MSYLPGGSSYWAQRAANEENLALVLRATPRQQSQILRLLHEQNFAIVAEKRSANRLNIVEVSA
ncbi:MAG: hypothetical protein V1857_06860 [archaeon]